VSNHQGRLTGDRARLDAAAGSLVPYHPGTQMRSPRRARLTMILTLGLLAVVGAAGLLGWRVVRLTPVSAGAATLTTPADLQRPPWFHLRVVSSDLRFGPGAVSASPAPVAATAGILVDLDTGAILWQQNAHQRLAPASTTKVLAALVGLDNFPPTTLVTVTPDALNQAWDETRMGLKAGEVLSVQELLSGMMLVSGNDAATALAVDTVGPERFVAAMNAQVRALGLQDSHFTTPVGLDDPEQYTSAYDLAVIGATAMRIPLFAELVGSRQLTLPATAGHPRFVLDSINLLLSTYPPAVGVKPGYTGNAGYCEVGMAVRDGHRLLSVLLHGSYVVAATRRLLDWGFQQEGLPTTLPAPTPSPSAASTHHG
jgi:D-alanyl-D-alanine carboxypeptidase (penicillin-binding protein 5/6)